MEDILQLKTPVKITRFLIYPQVSDRLNVLNLSDRTFLRGLFFQGFEILNLEHWKVQATSSRQLFRGMKEITQFGAVDYFINHGFKITH